MNKHLLNEDKLPQKLSIVLSKKINKQIACIENYNKSNTEGLSQWHDYLNGIKSYVSNPAIAWDYTNRYHRFPNGTIYISDFDYNVGCTIKCDNNGAYVYIFMVNLKPEDFELKVPPTLNENKQPIISTKLVYRVNESQLIYIIKESIRQVLSL